MSEPPPTPTARRRRKRVRKWLAVVIPAVAALALVLPLIINTIAGALQADADIITKDATTQSREYKVEVQTKRYERSAETIWVVIRTPYNGTFYPQWNALDHNRPNSTLDVLLGGVTDSGEFEIYAIAVDTVGNAAFAESRNTGVGLPSLPDGHRVLDQIVIERK